MEAVLTCSALTKAYGPNKALDNFTAVFSGGRITGLLGPNGSGKTTLMKLAAGLLVPTSGSLRVCGQAPGPQTKARVAYLPERTYLPAGLRVREALELFCDFYADFSREKAVSMLADLKIQPGDKISAMSKGTREKVQLVLVMRRDARLYVLDEPIGGVDPAARDYIHAHTHTPRPAENYLQPGTKAHHIVFWDGVVVEIDSAKEAHLIQFEGMDTPRRLSVRAKLEIIKKEVKQE